MKTSDFPHAEAGAAERRAILDAIPAIVASGVIRVPIAATYRLTAFREAVAHAQRGGKVMFDVDGAI